MGNVLKFLEGKRTYITAALLAVCNFGVALGWWTWEQAAVANGVLASFGLAFLRMGVDKAGKILDPK